MGSGSTDSAAVLRGDIMGEPRDESEMDDLELVLAYLFEMWTTGQEAKLMIDDLDLLMEYIRRFER